MTTKEEVIKDLGKIIVYVHTGLDKEIINDEIEKIIMKVSQIGKKSKKVVGAIAHIHK